MLCVLNYRTKKQGKKDEHFYQQHVATCHLVYEIKVALAGETTYLPLADVTERHRILPPAMVKWKGRPKKGRKTRVSKRIESQPLAAENNKRKKAAKQQESI